MFLAAGETQLTWPQHWVGGHPRHSANPHPPSGAQTLTPIPIHGSGHGCIPVEGRTRGALGPSEPILCSGNQGAEARRWPSMPLEAPSKGFPQKGEWMVLSPSCLWPGRTGTRPSWYQGMLGGGPDSQANIARGLKHPGLCQIREQVRVVERWRARVPSPFIDFRVSEHCQGLGECS